MKNYFYIVLLFCCIMPRELSAENKVSFTYLDEELAKSDSYQENKKDCIHALKEKLKETISDRSILIIYHHLFEEYALYQFDSAYVYAKKTVEVGERINKIERARGQYNLFYCCVSAGLFKEACDLKKQINIHEMDVAERGAYYALCARLSCDMASYFLGTSFEGKYIKEHQCYCDSAMAILPKSSYKYDMINALKQYFTASDATRILMYNQLLERKDIPKHEYAVIYSILGHMHRELGNIKKADELTIQSALVDIQTCTRETTAMKDLALSCFNHGDYERASKYAHFAMGDANAYNSRLRKLELQRILPMIDAHKIKYIEHEKKMLYTFLFIVLLSCLFLIVLLRVIFVQKKKVKATKSQISKQLDVITQIHAKLIEANEIKDQFIVRTLYAKSEYLDSIEKILDKIERKVKTKQFTDLKFVRSEFNIHEEREHVHSAFDFTFLQLFPNFIEELNQLLLPEEAVHLTKEGHLLPEIRILALIRLGISDNKEIATFLNLSVNTIYVYKARMKNKCVGNKEDFERNVRKIAKIISK